MESCLNACLPEPLSAKVDSRFQSKVLGCTVDDQKYFRKKLQSLHTDMKSSLHNGVSKECEQKENNLEAEHKS